MKLTIEMKLPCGCEVKHCASTDAANGANCYVALRNLSEILRWWLNKTVPNHVCSLVSRDNPTGNKNFEGAHHA
jgi:hypothetical protein